MKVEELQKTHKLYQDNVNAWKFQRAAYKGVDALIDNGEFPRHERESVDNYRRRKKDLYGLNLSRAIVDILNFYLFTSEPKSYFASLADDELLAMFLADCDKYGNSFENIVKLQSRTASIQGHAGFLVWRAALPVESMADQLAAKDYPVISTYSALNILDWREEGYRLIYLKLQEGSDYRIITPEMMELWRIIDGEAVLIEQADNPLGEIPFVWLINDREGASVIGRSDIEGVAKIDKSIVNNLSQIEEVIQYAAFPMMRAPRKTPGTTPAEDLVGVTAVLEFDPNKPDAKPDWLEAKCAEPVDAILRVLEFKTLEAYRSQNVTGLVSSGSRANSDQASAREFQMLNARLSNKSEQLERAQMQIMGYWAAWLGLKWDGAIERPHDFDIENLKADLDNLIIATSLVKSRTFGQIVQKYIAREAIDEIPQDTLLAIDAEIEAAPTVQAPPTGGV
jgi:hypothetical protein